MARIDADHVKRQIEALRRDHPDVFSDEEFAADVLEGETDLHAFLDRAVEMISDAEECVEVLKARKDQITTRQQRYAAKADGLRSLMLSVMESAEQTKVTLPAATISVRATPPKVTITDENAIPVEFWRVKREIDKTLLAAALKTGGVVDGAELSNGGTTLSIRRT
jgi:hypothetical protein